MSDLKPLVVKRLVAAAAIGAGTTKLTQLIATGEIRAVKSGKNLLIVVESLERYIASLPPAKLKPDSSYTKKPTAA
jgi:excisionase family DNA binding protein